MSAQRDHAIVLREWDFSETSQTVALFTRTHGVIRGLAKGARRDKAPYSGGFEAITCGEIVWLDKARDELSILTEWDLQEVYWGARRQYRAHLAGLYLVDIVRHALQPADPHPALFDHLADALRALEQPEACERVVLHAQWALLHELGSAPRLDDAPARPDGAVGFDPTIGRFVDDPGPEGPLHIWRVRSQTLALLAKLADTQSETAEQSEVPEKDIARASALLAAFLVHTLERDPPTRAALFGDRAAPNSVPNTPRR